MRLRSHITGPDFWISLAVRELKPRIIGLGSVGIGLGLRVGCHRGLARLAIPAVLGGLCKGLLDNKSYSYFRDTWRTDSKRGSWT